jgi:predicted helicase
MIKQGFIYTRRNKWFNQHNVCKLGKAINIPDRNSQYITGEIEKGYFYPIFSVDINFLDKIEIELQEEFKYYHIYKGGGIEFYSIEIIDLIEPFLKNKNYKYHVLTQIEIDDLIHSNRDKNIENKINPNELQKEILTLIPSLYKLNNILKLIWSCGLGKALMSIFIVHEMKFLKVAICVPSIYLQNQIEKEILRIYPIKKNILKICSNLNCNKDEIYKFIEKNNGECKFIISTYKSCHILVDKILDFDFKIGDEAHHLVGIENEDIEKSYTSFHKIKSKKTLFMTATEKIIENKKDKKCYSMDDENIFGKLLDKKSVHWAIENGKITDYHLLVLKNTEEEVNQIISSLKLDVSNKELFISAFMVLKSIEKYNDLTHITIYTNKTENAELVQIYIEKILETNIIKIAADKNDIYNKALHSKTKNNLTDEVDKFKNTKYGIISSVYIFGEGFDLPRLNGVCFAENMDSDIRIVQCALRPNRLENGNPNKKAYNIIPYIDNDDKSFDKIRKIIGKLRNVDESIEHKIHINILSKNINEDKETKTHNINNDVYFQDNENELLKLKLRLRYSKTLNSNFTEEQDELNYIRQLNKDLGINSKEDYIKKRLQHKMYIEQPEDYFIKKGVWTNWYDFIGLDTVVFIQSKQDWINFCKEKNIKSIIDYEKICDNYKELPRNPSDFYTNFTNIQNELGLFKIRR